MPGNLQPLVNSIPIVNADGTPTDYFIRWAQERQIDIVAGITSEEADQIILDWSVARDINTGNGLTGGGNLSSDLTLSVKNGQGLTFDGSGNLITKNGQGIGFDGSGDITVKNGTGLNFDGSGNLKLADTAVTPGTYGDATHVPRLTVDQQGRLTGVVSVAISTGGGGTPWWFSPPLASAFTTASGDAALPTLTDDANVGLMLDAGTPVTGDKSRVALMSIPSPTANWNCEGYFDFMLPAINFGGIGMYLRNLSTGKLYGFGYDQGAGSIVIQRRPGLSGFTSGATSQNYTALSTIKFFKITYTAADTNYRFYISQNGKHWFLLSTYNVTDHFGGGNQADQIGFGVCYNYSTALPAGITVSRWVKSW